MKNSKVIAITGGIGSGKSTVCEIIRKSGYPVFSSDQIVSELYEKRKVKKILKKLFPFAVKGLFLKIDRKKIADAVFNDKEKLDLLTKAITPLVVDEIMLRASNTDGVCFAEVPILFECGYQDRFSSVLIVSRPLEKRIESVVSRSKMTRDEVLSRINSQVDYSSIPKENYSIIYNDGDLTLLETSVLEYLKTL